MKDLLVIIGGVVVVVFAIVCFVDSVTRYQCATHAKVTGIETKHVPFNSCYVHHEGRFQRWDEYKARHKDVTISNK